GTAEQLESSYPQNRAIDRRHPCQRPTPRMLRYGCVELALMLLAALDEQRCQLVGVGDLCSQYVARRNALRVGFVQQHHCPLARIGALVLGGADPASSHLKLW